LRLLKIKGLKLIWVELKYKNRVSESDVKEIFNSF
jgi:hypothetical protein